MGKSGAERRGEAKRRRRPATCALYLVLFPRFNRGRAHAVGRVGVVAKRRLGGERSGDSEGSEAETRRGAKRRLGGERSGDSEGSEAETRRGAKR